MQFQEWNAKKELWKSNRARNKTRNFAQILQKKLHMQMVHKWRLLRICLVSIIFLPILIVIRNIGQSRVIPKEIFDSFAIDNLDKMRSDLAHLRNTSSLKFVEKIVFTPNAQPLEWIIAMAVDDLKLEGYVGVDKQTEIELLVREKHYMAGVVFNVDTPNITRLPSTLDFILRFPPTLRSLPQKNERFWPTRRLYVGLIELVTGKPEDRYTKNSKYGKNPPGYIQEGFIGLQHAISMAYIKLVGNLSTSQMPKIYMERYPRKRYIYDRLFVVIKLLLPIAMMFSYSYSSYKMVFFITDETEMLIMKSLKVEWLNFLAWFVVLFLLQFFITILSLFILSSCGWDQNVFQYSDPVTILCFMLAYLLANVTFTLMICGLVVHKSRSAVTVLVVHLLTYLPFPLIFVLYYGLPVLPKLLSCLILNTGLGMGLNIILDFERTAEGLQWDNFKYPHFAGSKVTLEFVVEMLLLATAIHILILIYVTGRYSASDDSSKYVDVEAKPVPWYYPFQALLNRYRKKSEIKILTNAMICELSSDATARGGKPKKRSTNNGADSLSVDFDVTVYQKNEAPLQAPAIAPILQPINREDTSSTSITLNRVESGPLLSVYSADLQSSTSSYEFSEGGYSTESVSPVEDAELANVAKGIKVINVSKSFEGIEYLSNITMTIHPKEVTVILGQKGAGKMLLSEIIAGTVKMTSGHVLVNGKNISEYKSGYNFDQPFAIMPRQEITFPLLTIKENLYFYTYLRGMRNHRQIAREIRKYSAKLDIPELMNKPVGQLQYGMNRCVGFCCVMCGGNHGIILDEPTLGLDEYGCHRIWNMIRNEGRKRTIIVCSHQDEEAVILGDRIAVLDWGRLQCYGKTQHLLETFCSDYFLNCKKKLDEKCRKKNEPLAMMFRYVPTGLQVRVNNHKQLHVRIPDGNEMGLGLILKELEQGSGKHNIQNFTLFRKTLRDVFIQNKGKRHSMPNSAVANILKFKPHKRRRRVLQFRAIFFKKLIYFKKAVLMPLFLLFLFTLSIIFELSPQGTEFINLPKMDITLCRYKNSHVLSKSNANLLPYMMSYKLTKTFQQYIEHSPNSCENIYHAIKGRREFIPYILEKQLLSFLSVETFYAVALDFYPDKIICFWNPKLLHSGPISINLLHNALLQLITNSSNATINLANHPIKFSHADFLGLNTLQKDPHLNIGTIPFLIFFTAVSLFTWHLMYELSSGRMMLELLSGVSHQVYWTTRFMWDMAMYTIMITVMVAIIVGNDTAKSTSHERQYSDVTMISLMLLVLEVFGLAVMPFIYCLSYLFENMMFGYLVTLLILTGTSLLPSIITPGIERVLDIVLPDVIQYLLYWSPSAILVQCMRRLHTCRTIKYCIQEICGTKKTGNLCRSFDAHGYFNLKYPGILVPLIILIVLAVCYSLLFNKISQSIVFRTFIKYCRYSRNSTKSASQERERSQESDSKEHRGIALEFDSVYSNPLKGVSFAIKHGEVFGIVGRFGSGKSKILEVTAGRDIIEKGDVYVYGKSIRFNRQEAFKYLGYCPKEISLHEVLTVRELLYFYCRLCGRRQKETTDLIEWLVTSLGLEDKLNVRISHLVFANCRKLSLAVAVISSTKVIMMDEPTRGMDPKGAEQIWQMIRLIQKMGRTVVLAMELLEECMPLCDRICILVNGRLECIGSVDYLIQKFSRGCILQVYTQRPYASQVDLENAHLLRTWNSGGRMGDHRTRITSLSQGSVSTDDYADDDSICTFEFRGNAFDVRQSQQSAMGDEFDYWERQARGYNDISEFMKTELPYARLEEQYSNMLVYYIPFNMLPISQVFTIMEAGKTTLNVLYYMIRRPSIVDMYEHFTKQNCRYWGKSASMTKLNRTSIISLARVLSATNLHRTSKINHIKRLFRKRKK